MQKNADINKIKRFKRYILVLKSIFTKTIYVCTYAPNFNPNYG